MVPHSTGAQLPDHAGARPRPRPPASEEGHGQGHGHSHGHGRFGEREFADWLAARLGEFLQRPAHGIDPRTPFAEYGLDSVAALSLYGDIEEEFALYLEPTVAWDHPTVEALARHLAEEYAAARPGGGTAARPGGAPRAGEV